MSEKKLFALRLTEAQQEILAQLAGRLKMTHQQVIGAALYRFALEVFRGKVGADKVAAKRQ